MVRKLSANELTKEFFEGFSSSWNADKCYRKVQGEWTIVERRITPGDIDSERKRLLAVIENGGTVLGAWAGEQCLGVVGIGGKLIGPQQQDIELFGLQMAKPEGSKAAIKELLEEAKKLGRQLGAKYLYFEAGNSVEEQRLWERLGFREAAWYREQYDPAGSRIAMECPLDGDWSVQDVYTHCPDMSGSRMMLRLVQMSDAGELLRCYSDKEAQRIFNSDNCTNDFCYETPAEMEECILFWLDAYEAKEFVRFTIRDTWLNQAVGTVELFHYMGEGSWKHRGVLRLDICSEYETEERLVEILQLINRYSYDLFHVSTLATKAIPKAKNRIAALLQAGFQPTEEKLQDRYGDYYIRECLHS